MITISLNLGNVPSVLAAMGDPRIMQRVVNAAAEAYVDAIHDWIGSGHSFTPGPREDVNGRPRSSDGGLQQAINWRPAGNGTAEVYANKDYAWWIEAGTRPHIIRPKNGKGLKIPVAGTDGYIVRRVVHHPGTRPLPFFFNDRRNRIAHMEARALSVLASVGAL